MATEDLRWFTFDQGRPEGSSQAARHRWRPASTGRGRPAAAPPEDSMFAAASK